MILTALFDGLWQGAIIVALTFAVSKLAARRSASTRCALWSVALVALVLVPVATTVSDAGAQLARAFAGRPAHAAYTIALLPAGTYIQHARGWIEDAAPWILAAWLVGVGAGLARLAVSFARVERIRRKAEPLESAEPDVYVSRDIAVPIVAGIVDPAIVVPKGLDARLAPADFKRVVEHERAHVLRRDSLWNLIARLIEAALFFNPWVRIAAAALSNEREAACDDWVVAKTGSADEYAILLGTLAQMLRTQRLPVLVAGAYRSHHSLVARIERLCAAGADRLNVNTYALGGTIVLFFAATLALQAFAPALALTLPGSSGLQTLSATSMAVAATCTKPNVEASVISAPAPSLPHGLKASGTVNVAVTIAPSGHVTATKVVRSSGNAAIDNAAVTAARNSTYSPKIVSCSPVVGRYLFRVDFAPSP